jgi:hypothetical protein
MAVTELRAELHGIARRIAHLADGRVEHRLDELLHVDRERRRPRQHHRDAAAEELANLLEDDRVEALVRRAW